MTYSLHCPSLSSPATHPLPIMQPKHCSCIHTSHLEQYQGMNIPGHQILMVFAVALSELDSFGSRPVQGSPKMAQHVFTGSPCHLCPPQVTPGASWILTLIFSQRSCVSRPLSFPISQILLGFQPSSGHIHIFSDPLAGSRAKGHCSQERADFICRRKDPSYFCSLLYYRDTQHKSQEQFIKGL